MPNEREQKIAEAAAPPNGGKRMKIGFFGKLRDALGDEREVAAEDGETVRQLRIRLAALHPEAARDLLSPKVRACVGDTMVAEDFLLAGHERVEFLPALSGG